MVKILAVIPARGGSKGVKNKNSKMLAGKPLINWTIEAALQSRYITQTIVSTDSESIAHLAQQAGCLVPFLRPAKLAQDTSSTFETVKHAINLVPGFDYVLLLQPTSPLRTVQDIDDCITLALQKQVEFCVSVMESKATPDWLFTMNQQRLTRRISGDSLFTRRQDLPKYYVLNGALYFASIPALLEKQTFIPQDTLAFEMPYDRSVDIDTEIDFIICEALLKQQIEQQWNV